jgi:hypothetical protein
LFLVAAVDDNGLDAVVRSVQNGLVWNVQFCYDVYWMLNVKDDFVVVWKLWSMNVRVGSWKGSEIVVVLVLLALNLCPRNDLDSLFPTKDDDDDGDDAIENLSILDKFVVVVVVWNGFLYRFYFDYWMLQ